MQKEEALSAVVEHCKSSGRYSERPKSRRFHRQLKALLDEVLGQSLVVLVAFGLEEVYKHVLVERGHAQRCFTFLF